MCQSGEECHHLILPCLSDLSRVCLPMGHVTKTNNGTHRDTDGSHDIQTRIKLRITPHHLPLALSAYCHHVMISLSLWILIFITDWCLVFPPNNLDPVPLNIYCTVDCWRCFPCDVSSETCFDDQLKKSFLLSTERGGRMYLRLMYIVSKLKIRQQYINRETHFPYILSTMIYNFTVQRVNY